MMLVICDIDGVVADCTKRLPYAKSKQYDRFYADYMIKEDEEIPDGIAMLESLYLGGARIVFCTGRNESCREATVKWLRKHVPRISIDALYMRKNGDHRKADKVKPEMVEKILESYEAREIEFKNILFIDDDFNNVKAVAAANNNITVLDFGIRTLYEQDEPVEEKE